MLMRWMILWMIVLGGWAWTLRPRLRRALLVTHGLLLLPGAVAEVAWHQAPWVSGYLLFKNGRIG
jgi:hypothetical protein